MSALIDKPSMRAQHGHYYGPGVKHYPKDLLEEIIREICRYLNISPMQRVSVEVFQKELFIHRVGTTVTWWFTKMGDEWCCAQLIGDYFKNKEIKLEKANPIITFVLQRWYQQITY